MSDELRFKLRNLGARTFTHTELHDIGQATLALIGATHRDDDWLPVDEAWLARASEGHIGSSRLGLFWHRGGVAIGSNNVAFVLTAIKTRGNVRDLCRVLGIELKEPPHAD